MKHLIAKTLLFLFLFTIFTSTPLAQAQNQKFVPDRILIKFKKEPSVNTFKQMLTLNGAQSAGSASQLKIKILKVHPSKLESMISKLRKDSNVEFAEKDWIAEPSLATGAPNDPYYTGGYEWHLSKINAPNAWSLSTGSATTPIAIVDTGVDLTHPDLSAKIIQGYNIYANTNDPSDDYGHGTAVAGTAAALSNNGLGVAGISWQSPVMPIKISDPTGFATYSDMAKGIIYAADHGVRVINISFGGRTASSTLQNAVSYAWQKNALVIAAAGNDSSSTVSYPAACQYAVAVSATLSDDTFASFSNYGNQIALSAPGKGIYTTMKGGGYGSWYGTSFSSPVVAGVAALVLSLNPQLTNVQVVDILEKTADDLGAVGYDVYFGYGRVNAYRALQQASITAPPPVDTTAPLVAITSPTSGSLVSKTTYINVSASDNVGVTQVKLYIDGSLVYTSSNSKFTYTWNTTYVSRGTHTLQAFAFDAVQNKGSSAIVSVKK